MAELWIIEPHDPLIVRDGRFFGPNPGARARSLDFPFPVTMAGGLRTRAGQDENGRFDTSLIPQVKQLGIRGPLLAELDADDKPAFLAPAPADALLLREDEKTPIYRHRLQPLTIDDSLTDLPNELDYPVGLAKPDLKKPYKDAPHYWHWDNFMEWLMKPPTGAEEIDPQVLGHNGPGKEWRMHVAIDPNSFTGIEGDLFATSGLEFWQLPFGENPQLSEVKRLALVAAVENLGGMEIRQGFAPWGGERRTMRWQKSAYSLPEITEEQVKVIAQTGCCRLILLTPAYFEQGWLPSWLLTTQYGITPKLKTAVVGKPQTVSGWDFEKNEAKPTRRLAPAASVYYLELAGDETDRQAWIKEMWLKNVSDDEADRLSGFGLAAIGIWSGNPQAMEVDNA